MKEKHQRQNVKDLVLKEWENGNVVFASIEGLHKCKFEDFINQPLEGILYDINRDCATVSSFLEDPKWINDFALTKLLEYYYNKCKEQEKSLNTKKDFGEIKT